MLYFDGWPSHEALLPRLVAVLSEGVTAPVELSLQQRIARAPAGVGLPSVVRERRVETRCGPWKLLDRRSGLNGISTRHGEAR